VRGGKGQRWWWRWAANEVVEARGVHEGLLAHALSLRHTPQLSSTAAVLRRPSCSHGGLLPPDRLLGAVHGGGQRRRRRGECAVTGCALLVRLGNQRRPQPSAARGPALPWCAGAPLPHSHQRLQHRQVGRSMRRALRRGVAHPQHPSVSSFPTGLVCRTSIPTWLIWVYWCVVPPVLPPWCVWHDAGTCVPPPLPCPPRCNPLAWSVRALVANELGSSRWDTPAGNGQTGGVMLPGCPPSARSHAVGP
jgi:hypothetical protein